ncbi:MAG: hypothetical protein IPK19_22995 [Chloroflexi bacterium]|nr:hypothetical protein [Chloroflexota bacterium]
MNRQPHVGAGPSIYHLRRNGDVTPLALTALFQSLPSVLKALVAAVAGRPPTTRKGDDAGRRRAGVSTSCC